MKFLSTFTLFLAFEHDVGATRLLRRGDKDEAAVENQFKTFFEASAKVWQGVTGENVEDGDFWNRVLAVGHSSMTSTPTPAPTIEPDFTLRCTDIRVCDDTGVI